MVPFPLPACGLCVVCLQILAELSADQENVLFERQRGQLLAVPKRIAQEEADSKRRARLEQQAREAAAVRALLDRYLGAGEKHLADMDTQRIGTQRHRQQHL